ncbi:hypothetical protein HYPSUDRAFT_374937 [Hypholoma sublateritium FD-334 SS-4]|uniref:Uncharacterized protein n=1 Tax=Hypholoma sublateritium (strain FD-334 SS-4) TaxID=945553 RepID=A0A0D2Q2D8_HYPSF|nr:hypothetical protein HYPSUDRAFT_374937 [Hypholoma sublateritium FD-334 SS-4]
MDHGVRARAGAIPAVLGREQRQISVPTSLAAHTGGAAASVIAVRKARGGGGGGRGGPCRRWGVTWSSLCAQASRGGRHLAQQREHRASRWSTLREPRMQVVGSGGADSKHPDVWVIPLVAVLADGDGAAKTAAGGMVRKGSGRGQRDGGMADGVQCLPCAACPQRPLSPRAAFSVPATVVVAPSSLALCSVHVVNAGRQLNTATIVSPATSELRRASFVCDGHREGGGPRNRGMRRRNAERIRGKSRVMEP